MNEVLSSNAMARKNQLYIDENEPRWFAVYTRYKREKMVNKRLQEQNIETYLPLQKVTRHYTRKTKHLELPLISCYIFTKITKPHYVTVLEDPDVVTFVKTGKDLIAIPEEQMEILRRIVGEGQEVAVETEEYRVGDQVEVIGGQLTGIAGLLVDKEGEKFFIVDLDFIDTRLRMKIDPKYLRVKKRGPNL
jgi:transcription antitermination factor NusG